MQKHLFTLCSALIASLFALALTGCGGGATSAPFPPNIQSGGLAYGKSATFYVGVTALNPGTTFSATNCGPLQSTTSTVEGYLAYRCDVSAAGPLVFTGTDAAGKVIATQNFTVPNPQVLVSTSLGNFVLELNQAKAPVSTDNFLRYVTDGFYKDVLFHRVIPNFVIQAGGFTEGLTPKISNYSAIALESQNGLSNLRGSLAMARTSDPNSATSQFYINLKDNTSLDYASAQNPGYAVFGSVAAGLTVIDAIAAVQTGAASGLTDVPLVDVTIANVVRIQ
jgi:cyclophilin family peptidyl-prolyl cis-trans isomerase